MAGDGLEDRGLIYWLLASLMVAEERITTKFSGLVGAYGSEEEATFLATQQVDEARHTCSSTPASRTRSSPRRRPSPRMSGGRQEVSPAFEQIFDVALVQAHRALVAAPEDLAGQGAVRGHLYDLEGTLGLTTFKFSTECLDREDLLEEELRRRLLHASTTTRHATSATASQDLREPVRSRPEQAEVVKSTLGDLLPHAEALSGSGDGGLTSSGLA